MDGEFERLLLEMRGPNAQEATVRYQTLCDVEPRGVLEGLVGSICGGGETRFTALVLLGCFLRQKESLFPEIGDAEFHGNVQKALIDAFSNRVENANEIKYIPFVLSRLACVYSKMGVWQNPADQLMMFVSSGNEAMVFMGIDALCLCVENGVVNIQTHAEALFSIAKAGIESSSIEIIIASLRLVYACLKSGDNRFTQFLTAIPVVIHKYLENEHIHEIMSNFAYFLDQNEGSLEMMIPVFLELIMQIIKNSQLDTATRTCAVSILDTFFSKCPQFFMNDDLYLTCFSLYVSVFNELEVIADSIHSMCRIFGDAVLAVQLFEALAASGGNDASIFLIFAMAASGCREHIQYDLAVCILDILQSGYVNANVEVRTAAFQATQFIKWVYDQWEDKSLDDSFSRSLELLRSIIPVEEDATALMYEIRVLKLIIQYHPRFIKDPEGLLEFLDVLLTKSNAEQQCYVLMCYRHMACHFRLTSRTILEYIVHVLTTRQARNIFFKAISVACGIVAYVEKPELQTLCEILMKAIIQCYRISDITHSERRIVNFGISEIICSNANVWVVDSIPTLIELLLESAGQDFDVSTWPTNSVTKSDLVECCTFYDASQNLVLSISRGQVHDIEQSLFSLIYLLREVDPEVVRPFVGKLNALIVKLLAEDKWRATLPYLVKFTDVVFPFFEPPTQIGFVSAFIDVMCTEDVVSFPLLPHVMKHITGMLKQIDINDELTTRALALVPKCVDAQTSFNPMTGVIEKMTASDLTESLEEKLSSLLGTLSEQSPNYSTIAAPILHSLFECPTLSTRFKVWTAGEYSRRCANPSADLLDLTKSVILASLSPNPDINSSEAISALGLAIASNRYDLSFVNSSVSFIVDQWATAQSPIRCDAIQFACVVSLAWYRNSRLDSLYPIFMQTVRRKMKYHREIAASAVAKLLIDPLPNLPADAVFTAGQTLLSTKLPPEIFQALMAAQIAAAKSTIEC